MSIVRYKMEILGVIVGIVVGLVGYTKPSYTLLKTSQNPKNVTKDDAEKRSIYQILITKPSYSTLLKSNPFSENRSYETKQPSTQHFKDLPDLKTLLGYAPDSEVKLVGVAILNGEKIAYLSDNTGKITSLREGDIVGGKYKVVSIDKNKVKLLINKEEKVLKIFDFEVKN